MNQNQNNDQNRDHGGQAAGFDHHITAAVIIAGTQLAQVDSHGGNKEGGHIAVTFGSQLMITMLDQDGADSFARTWTDPENRWVFRTLPQHVRKPHTTDDSPASDDSGDDAADLAAGAVGPGIALRASGDDEGKIWMDVRTQCAVVRVGNLTWYVRDQAAAESMILTWAYIARLAATALRPVKPRSRRR